MNQLTLQVETHTTQIISKKYNLNLKTIKITFFILILKQ
jgi:hypothetical protein